MHDPATPGAHVRVTGRACNRARLQHTDEIEIGDFVLRFGDA